eukprot:UN32455
MTFVWVLFATVVLSYDHNDPKIIGDSVFNLGDLNWSVINANKTIHINATVPGDIHSDLMKAGILGDPFYRFNDLNYRWVAYDNWTYSTTFNIPTETMAGYNIWIVCDGLEVHTNIYLNNHHILEATNSFRRWLIDITEFIDVK